MVGTNNQYNKKWEESMIEDNKLLHKKLLCSEGYKALLKEERYSADFSMYSYSHFCTFLYTDVCKNGFVLVLPEFES